eukprot:6190728-Pleurochrysis_carterae.AAC.1
MAVLEVLATAVLVAVVVAVLVSLFVAAVLAAMTKLPTITSDEDPEAVDSEHEAGEAEGGWVRNDAYHMNERNRHGFQHEHTPVMLCIPNATDMSLHDKRDAASRAGEGSALGGMEGQQRRPHPSGLECDIMC